MAGTIPRREFFRWSAGLAAAQLPSAVGSVTRRPSPPSPLPVVVVGAGLAGLSAALRLRSANIPVIVLEAQPRPGGRVRTLRDGFDEALFGEAGPVRIAPTHQRVRRFVERYGLSLVPFTSTNGSALVRARGVTVKSPSEMGRLATPLELAPAERGLTQGALLERYVGPTLDQLAGAPQTDPRWRTFDALSWTAWLGSQGASAGAVRLMTLGGESSQLSALYVLQQFAALRRTTDYFKIHGGMDQLPSAMAAELGDTVRYGASVMDLEHQPRVVTVGVRTGGRVEALSADDVIVTVPLSTMSRVRIQPPVDGPLTRAVRATSYYPVTRVLLQTRERFWHDDQLNASARSDDPVELWDASYDLPAGRGLLGMTIGGSPGLEIGGLARDEALERATRLAAGLLPRLSDHFEKGTIYSWHHDQWARGAFATFGPGGAAATSVEAFRLKGRLHVAGEHTSNWPGWMEGAIESGERAADDIIAARAAQGDSAR